jgi:hypothetical protein
VGPRSKLEAAVAARGKQYAAALKLVEDRVALTGNLDALMLLKPEREQGHWAPGFGAAVTKVPPEARDARRLLDADLARLRAAATLEGKRLADGYLKSLESIERNLTTHSDLAGALEVRKAREEMMEGGMDPINAGRGVVGEWRFTGKGVEPARMKALVTYKDDGTWANSNRETGTWSWIEQGRSILIKWDGKDRKNEYTLSPDATVLNGKDPSPTRVLQMKRIQ